jgi:2'-5' RNA ligase
MKPRKFSERLFIVADLPRFVREQIVEARKVWRKQLSGDVRWVSPQNLFLPLRYLGELERSKSKKLSAKLEKACASIAPIQLVVDRTGASPSASEAKSIWLGLQHSKELKELQDLIEACCAELKIARDKKPFQSRINLSKTSEPQAVPELPIEQRLKGFKVQAISLMESRSGQTGPSYHIIRKFNLRGTETVSD